MSQSYGNRRESSRHGSSRPSYRGGSHSNRGGYRGGRRRSQAKAPKRLDRSLFVSKPVKTQEEEVKPSYTGVLYSELQLQPMLAQNLAKKGYERTTEIQEKSFPIIARGEDMLGISATGSGKTGAFLIPMVQKMLLTPGERLMIIAPTRELAQQIEKEARSLLPGTKLFTGLMIGGESIGRQIWQIEKGIDILIGTPGRINDLIKRGKLDAQFYHNIVVDEVDRMFDMGFIDDVKFIFSHLGTPRQSLFFSATQNPTVEKIVQSLTDSYDVVKLANNKPTTQVVQSVIDYSHSEEKIDKLEDILNSQELEKAIIFVETKRYADMVQGILRNKGFRADSIHGDKRQNVRKRIIDLFRKSKIEILVATNVAARGIDIDDITHVINLDEPTSYDEYIHRIGRTGRNGAFGTAYTFIKRG